MKKIFTLLFFVTIIVNSCTPPDVPAELFTVKKVVGNNDDYTNRFKYYFKEDSLGKFVVSITYTPTSNSFTIRRSNDSILIKGSNEGMWYFLNKYCGVNVYMPDTLWISYPKDSVYIPDSLNLSYTPFTSVIFSTGVTNPKEYYKAPTPYYWQVANNIYNTSLGITDHSMCYRFMDTSMYNLFPDVYHWKYPMSLTDQSFEPDFTSPQIVPASMYSARKFFAKNPTLNYISFSVMDSYAGFPAPVNGKTLSQSFTDYMNELADSFSVELPGKTIVYVLYSQVAGTPYVKLRENILPITVYQISNSIADKTTQDSLLNKMSSVMNVIGNHDWAQGGGFIIPRIYSKLLDSFILKYQSNNIHINFAALEMYPNWGLDGIKYYEMAKIYDNPYINVDSLRLKFCNDMFGNVSSLMKEYFDCLENISTSMANDTSVPERKMYNYFSQVNLNIANFTLVDSARSLLNEALHNSTGEINQRVQFFSTSFKISEGAFNLYKDYSDSASSDYIKFLNDSIVGNNKYIYDGASGNFMSNINSMITQIRNMKK